jgi:AhpD family alkylhydroperoxidase
MQARMKNPAMIVPGAVQAIKDLKDAVDKGSLPPATHLLVHMRASQINGCSPCIVAGSRQAKEDGEPDERIHAVAAWRNAPYYTEAERAALALTEAVTRLSDRADPVPDEVWDYAAKHYDEEALATLILSIVVSNVFNRINVSTGQLAGSC